MTTVRLENRGVSARGVFATAPIAQGAIATMHPRGPEGSRATTLLFDAYAYSGLGFDSTVTAQVGALGHLVNDGSLLPGAYHRLCAHLRAIKRDTGRDPWIDAWVCENLLAPRREISRHINCILIEGGMKTTRRVETGEELLTYYGIEYWLPFILASLRCRGYRGTIFAVLESFKHAFARVLELSIEALEGASPEEAARHEQEVMFLRKAAENAGPMLNERRMELENGVVVPFRLATVLVSEMLFRSAALSGWFLVFAPVATTDYDPYRLDEAQNEAGDVVFKAALAHLVFTWYKSQKPALRLDAGGVWQNEDALNLVVAFMHFNKATVMVRTPGGELQPFGLCSPVHAF